MLKRLVQAFVVGNPSIQWTSIGHSFLSSSSVDRSCSVGRSSRFFSVCRSIDPVVLKTSLVLDSCRMSTNVSTMDSVQYSGDRPVKCTGFQYCSMLDFLSRSRSQIQCSGSNRRFLLSMQWQCFPLSMAMVTID
jgi:hypothetical protein